MVDLSEIKSLIHVRYLSNDDGTLYFTQIDNRDEKLRHLHHLHPLLAASEEVQNREYGVSRGQHHRIEL